MVLIVLYVFAVILTYFNSRDHYRTGNMVGVVLLGGFLCAFLNFVFANAFADTEREITAITSPIVREVVNNEVMLTFTTAPNNEKWSLPGDTQSEVGYRDSLVNNVSVAPSLWISVMNPTIPDYKSLLIAP